MDKVTLAFLITAILISSVISAAITVAYINLDTYTTHFSNQIEEKMKTKVNSIEKLLNSKIDAQKKEFMFVASHREVSSFFDRFARAKMSGSLNPPYPSEFGNDSKYRRLIELFLSVGNSSDDIEMLRIFWKDGYVVAGTVYEREDFFDYKGDKKWFEETISGNVSDIYISPINIARHTKTPAIRYTMPLYYDGQVSGLLIANYNFEKSFSIIKELYKNGSEHIFIVDPHYENAEGEILGPRFIVNTVDPSREFNESCPVCPLLNLADFQDKEGFVKFSYGNETEFYGYYKWARLKNGRDYLIISAVKSDVLTGLLYESYRGAMISAIGIAGIFGILGLVLSNFILRPIEDLIQKSRLISKGLYEMKIGPRRDYKEARLLSEAIGEMKENLYKYSKRLEEYGDGVRLVNSIIRHDIANHLTSALIYLEMYEETGEKDYLTKLEASLERLKRVLDVSRVLEAVLREGEKREVNLRDVLTKVGRLYPEIEINVEGDCRVNVDSGIEVVFDNLIQNSIKHGNASRVDIRIEETPDYCIIEYHDNGRGIPDEIADKIFEPGFSTSGGGFGLYIVKLMLTRYDGEITIERSEQGARFVIRIKK
ncbi:ATP-binding protein [Geoglobus acetivorans]|uniref:histidine kinase n=1 Tax=Geoglobus acetivorans TaxID=565033 RepID=A0ABZ3H501_GEOAI|nr:sensor histidine kinase [Geoglobus acetivorans]